MTDEYWLAKIAGYVHDPPDKVLDIAVDSKAHKTRAAQLYEQLTESCLAGTPRDRGNIGDVNSSSADRLSGDGITEPDPKTPGQFRGVRVDWGGHRIHTLSGQGGEMCPRPTRNDPDWGAEASKALRDLGTSAGKGLSSAQLHANYLLAWRYWSEYLRKRNEGWRHLPATTRVPDADIWGSDS